VVDDQVEGTELREYFIERFRQRVIYGIHDDTITVYVVVHSNQKPGRWHRFVKDISEGETL
jgi:hypothetical protein